MPKKTVIIAATYFYPEQMAAANRLYFLAQALSSRYRVRVYTAAEDPSEAKRLLAARAPGFSVHYVEKRTFSISNFFQRFFREISLSKNIYAATEFNGDDTVIVSAPSIFLIPFFVRKNRGRFLIIDIRDLVWEYLLQGNIIHKISGYLFKRMVLHSLKRVNLISVTNESEYRYITQRFPEKPVVLVHNGIDLSRFRRIQEKMQCRESDGSTIAYIGNVGIPQNLETLLHIAKSMPASRFIIAGGGSDQRRLMRKAEEMGLSQVEFTGYIEWEQVLEIYRTSDILYAKLDPSYIYAVPSKLYEYLSTGLPVVYEGGGAAAELLKQFERVAIVDNGESTKLEQSFARAGDYKGLSTENIKHIYSSYIRDDIFIRFTDEVEEYRNRK